MDKAVIKIFKRSVKGAGEDAEPRGDAAEVTVETRAKLVSNVNHWIAERRANRQLEKAFSDGKISSWKNSS